MQESLINIPFFKKIKYIILFEVEKEKFALYLNFNYLSEY